jgi:16S rRNA (cytidine1402-2'-O)-methyltransferase
LIARLRQGARIALVSDAGTPLVSDPGFKLVREAIQEGLPVHAVPGASAVLTGLVLAGLPSDRFLFAGFLPARSGERRSLLEELKAVRATLVFFESAQRLAESLADMADVFGVRTAAVTRELTKLHEEVRRGLLADLKDHYDRSGAPKGEVTLIVSPPHASEPDSGRIDSALDQALAFMPVRAAVDLVSEMLEAPRRMVYDRALAKKGDD